LKALLGSRKNALSDGVPDMYRIDEVKPDPPLSGKLVSDHACGYLPLIERNFPSMIIESMPKPG
jgi:hypothetical protein